jgi:putative glutamine amidotransferase
MTKDRRPLIGINADYYTPANSKTPHSIVQSGYYECLLTAGAVPVIIPPLTKETDLGPILDTLDGIMLTEGGDLDPLKMGLSPHHSVKPISDRRETCDRLICKLVQQRKMPILGIGLGMQEMNVCYGGGIYLHLPEDYNKGFPHLDRQDMSHRHIVIMEKGSMMEDIYGDGEICVNSHHHQGIRKIASGFRAGALAPDGLVEAIEWKGEDWFCVGVQWHAQNEGNISLDMQLIEAFVNAAAKSIAPAKTRTLPLAKAG